MHKVIENVWLHVALVETGIEYKLQRFEFTFTLVWIVEGARVNPNQFIVNHDRCYPSVTALVSKYEALGRIDRSKLQVGEFFYFFVPAHFNQIYLGVGVERLEVTAAFKNLLCFALYVELMVDLFSPKAMLLHILPVVSARHFLVIVRIQRKLYQRQVFDHFRLILIEFSAYLYPGDLHRGEEVVFILH